MVRNLTRNLLGQSRQLAGRAAGELALLALHEVDALTGHWADARERLAVARQARGLGELLRFQWDLLPETRARLRVDQRRRRALIAGLWLHLRGDAATPRVPLH